MEKLPKRDGSCAPLALAYVSGCDEMTVALICLAHDFTQEHGMEEHEWMAAARDLGIRMRRVNLKKTGMYRARLSKFLNHHPKGKFFIYTDAHLFVVENGKVVDPLNKDLGHDGLYRRVTGAWRVFE